MSASVEPSDRAASLLALAFVVAGPTVGAYGAIAAGDRTPAVDQLPLLLSAGTTGAALSATGAVVLAILRRRRAVAVRLDALARIATELGRSPR